MNEMEIEEEEFKVEVEEGVILNGIRKRRKGATNKIKFIWGHILQGSIEQDNQLNFFNFQPNSTSNYEIIKYDARGHGKSTAGVNHTANDWKWNNLAKDMRKVANKLNIGEYVLGGASMGCATAIHAALQEPERVKGLVLVIPPTSFDIRSSRSSSYVNTALSLSLFHHLLSSLPPLDNNNNININKNNNKINNNINKNNNNSHFKSEKKQGNKINNNKDKRRNK